MLLERRAIRVRGVVQGVGFRPTVYRLARTFGLVGFVRNDREGVWIEIEGSGATLDRFVAELPGASPPAARIDDIETHAIAARADGDFSIASSAATAAGAAEIPADLAPCDDCLRELADPGDRRHRYPFINCTACGPRFTIVREIPYDRPNTTMAAFAMCADCRREYDTPSDRRFHAEPNACPACGPRVRLARPDRVVACTGDAAVRAAAAAIAEGAIVAVKGAGGFVLAIDARDAEAVSRLRERKRRPDKPFAVMARSLEAALELGVFDDDARARLASPARPIVIVPLRPGVVAPGIAPGLADIGIFLPPTPLQHLLLADGPPLQVMTSGNVAEEPIARTDDEALERLAGIAELFVLHDREIRARADDSVWRGAIPMRRARGCVPGALALPASCAGAPPVLAVGAHERNTVCLVRDGRATLSQHVGDLDHPVAEAFFREAIAHLEELAGASPEAVAHDLHPDYRSTRWAMASPRKRLAVQHHHAHVAACLVEHGRDERVVGIAFDGTGLGDDNTLWGGEVLDADLGGFQRVAHLRPIALPGGELAIRQPWRLAAAALHDAGESLQLLGASRELQRVGALLRTNLPARATGAGRWFDAAAALIGVARIASYDGQAAAELEAIAAPDEVAPFDFAIDRPALDGPLEIDLRPTIRELVRGVRRGLTAAILAARFHTTLATAIRETCRRLDGPLARRPVVLTGGCFQNRLLLARTRAALSADGREVLVHERIPPNDGGIALGQAAIASYRLAKGGAPCA